MFLLKPLPGKEKSLLSTVRAMDCSLTTSMDCPICTVDGMLPRVPRTNSATSCTVNICSSSSKIAGNEFNRAAWGRGGRDGGEWQSKRNTYRGGQKWKKKVKGKEREFGLQVNNVSFWVEKREGKWAWPHSVKQRAEQRWVIVNMVKAEISKCLFE